MLEQVETAAKQFTDAICNLTDEQLRAPSCLPGWSRAHVIAHVALNAEGFVAVAEASPDQRPALMYPGGTGERDEAIEQLSRADRDELDRRFREANTRFFAAWSSVPLERARERKCATAQGHPTFSSSTIPQRRMRELQVHLIDLDVDLLVNDVGVDAWLPDFVDTDLTLQWPTVAQRTSEIVSVVDEFGVVWETDSSPPGRMRRVVERRHLLAWVLDRGAIEGMPKLESWSNRSKWERLSSDS